MQFPDSRAVEGSMAALLRRMEKEDISEPEEINEFVEKQLTELKGGEALPTFEPETPLEEAQAVMYRAWGASGKRQRVRLAANSPNTWNMAAKTKDEPCSSKRGSIWLDSPKAMDWLVDVMIAMGPPDGWAGKGR